MRSFFQRTRFVSAFLGVMFATGTALAADPPCASLDRADTPQNNTIKKIYIESGDTQTPMLQRLGAELLKADPPLRIIFRERPTCNLARDLFTGAKMNTASDNNGATPRPVRYIPDNTTIAQGTKAPICTVPDLPADAQPIQLGVGATYLSSCSGLTKPDTVGVVDGPVQAYGFITSNLSSQVAITAEEGHFAFGYLDGAGEASPWVLKSLKFQRAATASTTLTMAAAIRVPASQMQGTILSPDTSDSIITSVKATGDNPDAVLGVLGMDLYDVRRADVKLLAFRTFGQRFAYFPDATSASFDKVNVRDGHYAPWSPTPYISSVVAGGNGTFTDPDARRVFELVMGLRGPGAPTADPVDGLKAVIQSSLIPECAMKVTRAGDGADFQLYADPSPCGCYFEKNVQGGATSCTTCTQDSQCGTGHCRYGYCEAR